MVCQSIILVVGKNIGKHVSIRRGVYLKSTIFNVYFVQRYSRLKKKKNQILNGLRVRLQI